MTDAPPADEQPDSRDEKKEESDNQNPDSSSQTTLDALNKRQQTLDQASQNTQQAGYDESAAPPRDSPPTQTPSTPSYDLEPSTNSPPPESPPQPKTPPQSETPPTPSDDKQAYTPPPETPPSEPTSGSGDSADDLGDEFEINLEHEYHNLGNDYYRVGEFDKAIEHFNKALELAPDLLEAYFNRSLAYTRKGEYDHAMDDLNKVIELNPNLAEAYYTRGLVHEYKQEYDLAVEDYEESLDIDPGYAKAQTQLDSAKGKLNQLGGAGASGSAAAGTGGAAGPETGEGLTEFRVLEKPNMKFDDVAGLMKVKEKLRDSIVYPLTNPELAKKYGMEAGGGILLYGPPGCGKTLMGKASAGECQAKFISVKMSDIVDMYAGNTEKNLHNAFETARVNIPCILYFDELDGIAGKREGMDQSFEKRSINQFLIELDGIEYSNQGVLICGATNAPWDVDAALRRSGRFSKSVYIAPPDRKTRAGIVELNLKKRPVESRIPVGRIARMTDGFAGADVKALCDAAAAIPWKEALKSGKERVIRFRDFVKATKGDEGVKSTLPAWFGSVKKKLIEDEEEDEKGKKNKGVMGVLINDVFSLDMPKSEGGGSSEDMTVKHKQENKDLIPEEERQLFHALIRDIKDRTDPTKKLFRKIVVVVSKYVM